MTGTTQQLLSRNQETKFYRFRYRPAGILTAGNSETLKKKLAESRVKSIKAKRHTFAAHVQHQDANFAVTDPACSDRISRWPRNRVTDLC